MKKKTKEVRKLLGRNVGGEEREKGRGARVLTISRRGNCECE